MWKTKYALAVPKNLGLGTALFFHRLCLISSFGRDDAVLFVLVPRRPRCAAAPAAAARPVLGALSSAE